MANPTIIRNKLVAPVMLPGDVTQKRMIGMPVFNDKKQIIGGSGVKNSLVDQGGQQNQYTTREEVGTTYNNSSQGIGNYIPQTQATPPAENKATIPYSLGSRTNNPNTTTTYTGGGQGTVNGLPGSIPDATVPTSSNPVTVTSKNNQGGVDPKQYDYTNYDENQIYDVLDKIHLKQMNNEPLTKDEQMQYIRGQRALEKLQKQQETQGATDLYNQQIAREQQAQLDAKAQAIANDNLLTQTESDRLDQILKIKNQAQIDAGNKEREALGFIMAANGVSQSTAAMDKQGEIVRHTNDVITYNNAVRDEDLAKYKAQVAGATREELAKYDERINSLVEKATDAKVKQIEAVSKFNKETGANTQKKIDDMLALTSANTIYNLTDDEKGIAKAYGSALVSKDGDINLAELKNIPVKLQNEAMQQALIAKGAMTKEPPKTINTSGGAFYRDGKDYVLIDGSQKPVKNSNGTTDISTNYSWSSNTNMRTDRNNNPVAMTTDVAKTLGLVEGVDYTRGDVFPNNSNLFTAKLLGDPIQTVIKGLDKASLDPNKKAFYTQGGQQRRTHTGMSDEAWNNLTQEQKQGVVVSMYHNEGGSGILAKGVSQPLTTSNIKDSDILVFNRLTPSETSKRQSDPAFIQFVNDKNKVMTNPEADISDILKYSQGGKGLGDGETLRLNKYETALNQIGDLQDAIKNTDTGPILGILRSNNPYDVKAQAIQAQINALIPNLARGVYGEVGVLTDADIAQYTKTVPNLKSTKEVNDALLSMTIRGLANGYKGSLQGLAASSNDVSGYRGLYDKMIKKSNGLLDIKIPDIKAVTNTTNSTPSPYKVQVPGNVGVKGDPLGLGI